MISLTAFDRWYIITLLPLSPPLCSLSYLLALFLSMKMKKKAAFPRHRRNVLAVAFFFSYFCKIHFSLFLLLLIGHVALQHWIPSPQPSSSFVMRMDAPTVCYDGVKRAQVQFLGKEGGPRELPSQGSPVGPQWKLLFPSGRLVKRHAHRLPQQTHVRVVDLTPI